MDVSFTVIAWSEAVMAANDACQLLQDKVSPHFSNKEFGADIEDFIVVAVAVSEDEVTNARFYNAHTRIGYVKNASTGAKTKAISVGIPVPMLLNNVPNKLEIAKWIVSSLGKRLRVIKYPKQFNSNSFISEIIAACEVAVSRDQGDTYAAS